MRVARLLMDYAIAFFILCSLGFVLPRLLPGDPFLAIYGEEAALSMTPEMKVEIYRRFALDQSWTEQFGAYVGSLLRGDLGWSYFFNTPVMRVMTGFLPWTLLLAGASLLISTVSGFVLGLESGSRKGSRWDKGVFAGLMLLGGVPDFFVGTLLLLGFAVIWPLFPLGGATTVYGGLTGWAWAIDVLRHLALPLASLVLARMTTMYLLCRNSTVALLRSPFLRTARSKGCDEVAIRYRHLGRSVLLPAATSAGLHLSHLFAGILMIEVVFGYPGMGTLLQRALAARDYPLLQGILLLASVAVLGVNFIVELLYPILDPRVKTVCTSNTGKN
ncbi:MAG TPA: ABC transporter permease [Negativicutes bacterium]|nr:ABC transporter permease [Negativicutes bacterium]